MLRAGDPQHWSTVPDRFSVSVPSSSSTEAGVREGLDLGRLLDGNHNTFKLEKCKICLEDMKLTN